ncbi:MAG: hypothetical protein KatS3mg082_0558 [Nitrospiraceae bacterium]|nr:MAG: hypothetical protein KatS3mg082_0558 [Nitrospiraceae bacterium]
MRPRPSVVLDNLRRRSNKLSQWRSTAKIEQALKWNSRRSILLLLGFVVCLAMFGTDYPDQGLLVQFDQDDQARFVGIFGIIVLTYAFGYFDGRFQEKTA